MSICDAILCFFFTDYAGAFEIAQLQKPTDPMQQSFEKTLIKAFP